MLGQEGCGVQSENASNTGKGERGVEGHYKKRVERGWEHEGKEASLLERSERRDKQKEVREVWGEGGDGKGAVPMQRLAF